VPKGRLERAQERVQGDMQRQGQGEAGRCINKRQGCLSGWGTSFLINIINS
jgi:hypothetical protein